MKVILAKNYEKKNKRLLKGAVIEVTPWFKIELERGGYLGVKKVHTRTVINKETKNE